MLIAFKKMTNKKMGRKKTNTKIPSYDQLMVPTVKALIELGGSGTIEEIVTV